MPDARRPRAALAGVVALGAVLAGCAPGAVAPPLPGAEVAAAPLGPWAGAGTDGEGEVEVLPGLVYAEPGGVPLALDACLPTEPGAEARPAVVFLHGGSWRRGARDEASSRAVCEWLASAGYPAFSASYRLAPDWAFPAATDDVRAALAWLREPEQLARFGMDPARIALLGSSAGGNLAAWVATAGEGAWSDPGRVAALVELSAPVDLSGVAEDPRLTPHRLDYLGCATDADCPAAALASPQLQVDASDPPALILHSADEYVPLEHAEILASALEAAGVPVELVVVPGDRHAIHLLDADARTRILDFLDRTLHGETLLAVE